MNISIAKYFESLQAQLHQAGIAHGTDPSPHRWWFGMLGTAVLVFIAAGGYGILTYRAVTSAVHDPTEVPQTTVLSRETLLSTVERYRAHRAQFEALLAENRTRATIVAPSVVATSTGAQVPMGDVPVPRQ